MPLDATVTSASLAGGWGERERERGREERERRGEERRGEERERRGEERRGEERRGEERRRRREEEEEEQAFIHCSNSDLNHAITPNRVYHRACQSVIHHFIVTSCSAVDIG